MKTFLLAALFLSASSWPAESEKKKPTTFPKLKIEKPKNEPPPPPPKTDPSQDTLEPAPAPVPDID